MGRRKTKRMGKVQREFLRNQEIEAARRETYAKLPAPSLCPQQVGLVLDQVVHQRLRDGVSQLDSGSVWEIEPCLWLKKDTELFTCYENAFFCVQIESEEGIEGSWPDMWRLTVQTKTPSHTLTAENFQTIKAQLIGSEHDAIRLQPSSKRGVRDNYEAEMYVLKDPHRRFPFGYRHVLPSFE